MSISILMYLSLKTFVLQRWWRGWWCLSHHDSSHNPASQNLVNTSAEWTGLAWFGQLAIWATYEREYILHSYTCNKELWASSNSKAESAVFLWRANEFIPAESCSARLQLGYVFSQSNLIVPNLDQNPIQCSRCRSCVYSLDTGISAAASAANTHSHVNSKQRHCIFLWVIRFQSVSIKLLVSARIQNLSTRFQRSNAPSLLVDASRARGAWHPRADCPPAPDCRHFSRLSLWP